MCRFGLSENGGTLKRRITVNVQGGLGNQLFNLHAGLAWSLRLQVPLVLDQRELCWGSNPSRQFELRSFDLEAWTPRDVYRDVTVRAGSSRITSPLGRRLSSRLRRELGIRMWTPEVGFDSNFDANVRPGSHVEAYSQTFVYAEFLEQRGFARRLPLVKTSTWLFDMIQRICEERVLAVHIRLGDYRQLESTHGIPSPDYYGAALRNAQDKLGESKIWIFSDEPGAALDALPSSMWSEVCVVDPPSEVTPAESLALLSHASAFVIGNSTFAWWGAWMSGSDSVVIAPHPWLNGQAVKRLVPASWQQLDKNSGANTFSQD